MNKLMLVFLIWSAQSLAYPGMGKNQEPTAPTQEVAMDAQMALAGFQEFAAKLDTHPVEAMPVLANGRIKPLYSLAKETILFVSGSAGKWGLSPLQMYLGLGTSKVSVDLEFINVRSPELREELGFAKTKRFFTLRELEQSQLGQIAEPLAKRELDNRKSLTPHEKDTLEAFNQTWVAQQLIHNEHFLHSIDIAGQSKIANPPTNQLLQLATEFITALEQNPSLGGEPKASELVQAVRSQPVPELFQRQLKNLDLEVFYQKAHFFLLAAIFYLVFGSLLQLPITKRLGSLPKIGVLFAIPALLQAIGFAIRVYITGFAPVTSMYGTMIWVSLGVGLFSMVLFALYRAYSLVGVLWIGAGLILLLTESIPLVLNPDMDPIVAVLRSNYWLTIHVLTITISYAAFTVAMLIGNTALIRSLFISDNRKFFQEYAHYAYRMIQLGVFLISVGIILGGIWADYSWGRFWGWDPKETWALIADIGYIVILHARYAGWLNSFAVLAASPIAYLLVVMAWYGVNFILAAGLHSYGFSSGGAMAVAIFVTAQIALLLVAASLIYRKKSRQTQAP